MEPQQTLSPDRKCKCAAHIGNEAWHDSTSGYTYHKCRCDRCHSAWLNYNLEYQRGHYTPKPRIARPKKAKVPWSEIPGGLVERRKKLWVEQSGLCALCLKPVDFEKSHLDHDHNCCDTKSARSCGKCDRGVLHPGCNTVLAIAKDDPEYLRLALEYLVANGKERPVWLAVPESQARS